MSAIKVFRIIGYLEGISYLLLLGLAVPLKYLGGNPVGVRLLGMPHGMFFIAYVALAFYLSSELVWPKKRLAQALLASILPFGTLLFDRRYLSTP